MPIKSIFIEKTTKVTRKNQDTIILNLEAISLDGENNFEPGAELQLYINNQLLGSFDSGRDGKIKSEIVCKHNINESDGIGLQLKDIKTGVESKIKYVFIEQKETIIEKEEISQGERLYDLHKDIIQQFTVVDEYFKKLIKGFDENLIVQEFKKVETLSKLQYNFNIARKLEFYDKYKDKVSDIEKYSKSQMTIYDIDNTLLDIQTIINEHNSNIEKFRKELIPLETKVETKETSKGEKLYDLHKDIIQQFIVVDEYFKKLIKGFDENLIAQEFEKVKALSQLQYNFDIAYKLEFYDKYKDRLNQIRQYSKSKMTIYEIDNVLHNIQTIINEHNSNIYGFKEEINQKKIKEEHEKKQKELEEEELKNKIEQKRLEIKKIKDDIDRLQKENGILDQELKILKRNLYINENYGNDIGIAVILDLFKSERWERTPEERDDKICLFSKRRGFTINNIEELVDCKNKLENERNKKFHTYQINSKNIQDLLQKLKTLE